MTGSENHYPVRVPIFEGPLDLLLHLVRVNAVDITDIPILEITRQYEEYLDWMRELNLEVAADFLVMAATLVYIKSCVLLPREPVPGEAETGEDPRQELTRMLLEHQRFREVMAELRERETAQAGVRYRSADALESFEQEFHLEVGLFDLLSAFQKVLQEKDEAKTGKEIPAERFPLQEAVQWLLDRVETGKQVGLAGLFRQLPGRFEMIAVFLGLLELIRVRAIHAEQGNDGESILLRRQEGAPAKWTLNAAGASRPSEESIG